MQWNVASAHLYTVRRKYDLQVDGIATDGLTMFARREIWLDGLLAGEALEETARHEYGHALEYHTAQPRNEEERKQFEATVAMAFNKELSACGGWPAVLALPIDPPDRPAVEVAPKPTVHAVEWQITDRVECGYCGVQAMTAPAQHGTPTMNDAGVWMVERSIECDMCDSIMVWDERCSPEGFPLGQYFNARVLRKGDASAWRAGRLAAV